LLKSLYPTVQGKSDVHICFFVIFKRMLCEQNVGVGYKCEEVPVLTFPFWAVGVGCKDGRGENGRARENEGVGGGGVRNC
jgi:hypothetical protein